MWLLLVAMACGATWYVTTHGLPGGAPAGTAVSAATSPSGLPGGPPTLEQVNALRANATALRDEAFALTRAIDDYSSAADEQYRKAGGPHRVPYSRAQSAWEQELHDLLRRMGMRDLDTVVNGPGALPLKWTEDALMGKDDRAAARHWATAQTDVRTFEGYLERVRASAAEHGLAKHDSR